MSNGSDIVVTGGSVEIEYDSSVYVKEPGTKKHKNQTKKITRIEITGDKNWDSGNQPNGLNCQIKVSCK